MRTVSWLLVLLLAITVFNYPNPFNPQGGEITTIECTPATTAEAYLYIYDMSARLILRKDFNLQGGIANRTTWNGYSDYNQLVGNGVYLYQIIDKAKKRIARGKIWVINQ
ncbi:hypothetical protein AMJ44_05410 [candidate division WOR-1 bacterium DG_54_3]|uniref:FlgD Ig-like domain-containing protein n=1 Tax=candidate division WOR-1 bacterium DG_54_3 TaxID=1703775 RepID=A0A0S7Y2A6_UNCSA|nr:MAG: hypothetical protein AMJ44_05410 [candidate division WOR-1 bacterium DG_54_3]